MILLVGSAAVGIWWPLTLVIIDNPVSALWWVPLGFFLTGLSFAILQFVYDLIIGMPLALLTTWLLKEEAAGIGGVVLPPLTEGATHVPYEERLREDSEEEEQPPVEEEVPAVAEEEAPEAAEEEQPPVEEEVPAVAEEEAPEAAEEEQPSVTKSAPPPQPRGPVCPNCGYHDGSDRTSCPHCGMPLEPP